MNVGWMLNVGAGLIHCNRVKQLTENRENSDENALSSPMHTYTDLTAHISHVSYEKC